MYRFRRPFIILKSAGGLLSITILLLASAAACSNSFFPSAVNSDEAAVTLHLGPSRAAGRSWIDHFSLKITGAGMSPYSRIISGGTVTVRIPAGPDRRFVLRALDSSGYVLYKGLQIKDLPAGKKISLSIKLSTQVWYVKADASGAGTGLSWANAFTALPPALNAVANAAERKEIWVASAGIHKYLPTTGTDRNVSFTIPRGVRIYGGFDGTEKAWDQRDPASHITVLSGDIGTASDTSDNSYTVVRFQPGTGSQTVLAGFSIQEGNADGTGGAAENGGGIYLDGGAGSFCRPQIAGCTITANLASGNGGGVYLDGAAGEVSPQFSLCTFTSNNAGGKGGALYADLAGDAADTPRFSACQIGASMAANSAAGSGGGLKIDGSSHTTIQGSTIAHNSSSGGYGGGINCYGTDTAGPAALTLVDTVIRNNSADVDGGGLYIGRTNACEEAPLSMENCLVTANSTASGDGGGLAFYENGTNTLVNTVIRGNLAGALGGGIFARASGAGDRADTTLINCTVTGNSAGTSGGGICNDYDTNSITQITLTNTIVWNNNDASADPWATSIYNQGGAPATDVQITHSLIQGAGPSGTWGSSGADADLTDNGGNIDADPLFHTDTDPGNAPTDGGDPHLQSGSPALGAGTSTGAPTKDKEGSSRTSPPSMGAYSSPFPHYTASLRAHYLFNMNLNDERGLYGASGSVNGAASVADRFGSADSAYSYDGTDDSITLGFDSDTELAGDFTISLWFSAASLGVNQPLLTKDTDGAQNHPCTLEVGMQLATDNSVGVFMGEGTDTWNWPLTWSDTALNLDTWYHAVMVLEGSELQLYLNGVQDGPNQTISTRVHSTGPIVLGGSPDVDGGTNFNGRIDDLRIYNRALSDGEISSLYNGEKP